MWGFAGSRLEGSAPLLPAAQGIPRDAAADKRRQAALRAQALPLVHLLAASLRVDRSLSAAIRFAARHAGGVAAEELARLEWAVRLRHFADVDEGFMAFAAAAGRGNPELQRALVTLKGAEGESTMEGLERRLDRAYSLVTAAEARRRERLTGSLERPSTVLFGAAVVLPLALAALAPMLQISAPGFGLIPLALLLVVAVPALTLIGISGILRQNFLGAPFDPRLFLPSALAALAPPAAGGAVLLTALAFGLPEALPLHIAVALAAGTAAAISGRLLAGLAREREVGPVTVDGELADLLHAVGSRMEGGRPAEHALLGAVEGAAPSRLTRALRGILFDVIVGRRSLEQAVAREEDALAGSRAYPALQLLASAAERDAAHAGRVALHLSEFERGRADALESLQAKVRGVVATIRTTVSVFAPLILGVTAGMYGLFGRVTLGGAGTGVQSGANDSAHFAAFVVVYLVIQAILGEWFAARLTSPHPLTDFGRKFARVVPLALGLFTLARLSTSALF